jgi:hypothetical protein
MRQCSLASDRQHPWNVWGRMCSNSTCRGDATLDAHSWVTQPAQTVAEMHNITKSSSNGRSRGQLLRICSNWAAARLEWLARDCGIGASQPQTERRQKDLARCSPAGSALPTSPFQHTRKRVEDQAYHGLRLVLRGSVQGGFGRPPFRKDPDPYPKHA